MHSRHASEPVTFLANKNTAAKKGGAAKEAHSIKVGNYCSAMECKIITSSHSGWQNFIWRTLHLQ